MAVPGRRPPTTTASRASVVRRPEESVGTIAILGHAVTDVITVGAGAEPYRLLGGAGAYAAIGARLVAHENVVLVSGVGSNFAGMYGRTLQEWQIDPRGLSIRDARTPQTNIVYHRGGSRTETSLLGNEHFERCAPDLADIPTRLGSGDGLYYFGDASPEGWSALVALRKEVGVTVLWEMSALETGVTGWRRVAKLLPNVDVLSINVAEARALVGASSPEEAISRFTDAGVETVCLRAGERGSFVADTTSVFAVSTPDVIAVDPTGAGNAYSGAFLAALVAGQPVDVAGRLASTAASYIIEQYGIPTHRPSRLSIERRAAAVGVVELTSSKEAPIP